MLNSSLFLDPFALFTITIFSEQKSLCVKVHIPVRPHIVAIQRKTPLSQSLCDYQRGGDINSTNFDKE